MEILLFILFVLLVSCWYLVPFFLVLLFPISDETSERVALFIVGWMLVCMLGWIGFFLYLLLYMIAKPYGKR